MKTGYSFGSLASFVETINSTTVKLTGDQTIGGIKTFSSNPISSAAQGAGGSYLTRKDYVDGALALKAPLASPALRGTPTAPTAAAGTNTTQLATTAFVTASNTAQLATVTPLMNGTAAIGASTLVARQDHVHPIDTSRAPLASPTFTGTPTAPTAAAGTNTTQIATTAFVVALNAVTVKITGDQTIAGVKTFSSNPISSASQGADGRHLTRKDYVDGCFEFMPIIENITVSSLRNYRFMAHAIATLPNSGASIRFIVDHSVDLTSGNCVIQAPAGETIVAPRGSDNQVRIKQMCREFVFVKINNQWRVS